jgi:hypothetical protein
MSLTTSGREAGEGHELRCGKWVGGGAGRGGRGWAGGAGCGGQGGAARARLGRVGGAGRGGTCRGGRLLYLSLTACVG